MRSWWLLAAGCTPEPAEPGASVTWAEAGPALARCVACHDGSGQGVALRTPAEVAPFAEVAAVLVRDGEMPPWPAAEADVAYTQDGRLPDAERELLLRWFDAGAPGPADAEPVSGPAPVTLERVDQLVRMESPWTPRSSDETRCFVLDRSALTAPFVTGVQVVPGAPELVHHLLLSAVVPDGVEPAPSALDAADPDPGWACPEWLRGGGVDGLGGWLPGRSPTVLPANTGLALAPDAELVLQAHYRGVVAGSDRSEVHFSTANAVSAGAAELRLAHPDWVAPEIAVAAGSTRTWRYETTLERVFPQTGLDPARPLDLLAVIPHQHERGVSIRVLAVLDGVPTTLVDIPDWDFDWQLTYTFAEPLAVALDDSLRLECTFRNDSDRDVQFGEEVTDEMCVARILMAEHAPE